MWTVRIPNVLQGAEILIYGYLQKKVNSEGVNICYVEIAKICEELGIKNSKMIDDTVKGLLSTEIIQGEIIGKGGIYKIIGKSLNPKNYFVMLPWECLERIVASGHKYKYQLLTFYAALFTFKDVRTGTVSKIPFSAFPTLFGIGVQTGVRYIKFLEDLGVLVVNHSRPNSGYTNTYSLPDEPLDKFQNKEYYNDKDTTNA